MLQHGTHQIPVTALALSENYIFAGEGPLLVVYRRHDLTLATSLEVFDSQAVHGIELHENQGTHAVVWGGLSVAALSLKAVNSESSEPELEILSTLSCPDWILHAAFRPTSVLAEVPETKLDDSKTIVEVALITAHNALLSFSFESRPGHHTSLVEHTSGSKCILYSANLQWTDIDHILIASGTVFGEILVWSCSLAGKTPLSSLHRVLTGHDGSIFGVQLSHDLSRSDSAPLRLLASCSDDRTIRVWDVTDLPATSIDPQEATDSISVRETGFGANLSEALPASASSGLCVAKAWGHISRIWCVRFAKSCSANVLSHLISFGEDATCHFWNLSSRPSSVPGEYSYELSNMGSSSLHAGKNIWSSAMASNGDNALVVATGGADGGLVFETKALPFVNAADSIQISSIEEAVEAIPWAARGNKQDRLRSYAFVNHGDLVVTTNSGNVLMLGHGETKDLEEHLRWQWICHQADLQGYSVMTSVESSPLAFVAGSNGNVYMFNCESDIQELVQGRGKTAALFARQVQGQMPDRHVIHLLVATVGSSTALLVELDHNHKAFTGPPPAVRAQISLELPPGFIITSFLSTRASADQASPLLVFLGSRNGTLALYIVSDTTEKSLDDIVSPSLLRDEIHGLDAVTDLAWIAEFSSSSASGWLFSTGRDGTLAIHRLQIAQNSITLTLAHQTTVPIGTNVERLIINEAKKSLQVCGFRSKHFILFDMITEREAITIDCGGANRSWTFEPSYTSTGGILAWTKASQLCIQSHSGSSAQTTNSGSHGREIKAIAVSPSGTKTCQLIATGAEDTDIKIFRYERDLSDRRIFRCLRTIKKHNTGVQHLEWSRDGRYLFSSGGFEEFYVWKIQRVPLLEIGVVCESACPIESELPDLRIMSFCVEQRAGSPSHTDVDVDEFIISLVRSDSTLRTYRYTSSPSSKTWECLAAGSYLNSCLTQILHIPGPDKATLLTAATDGHVAFWPEVATLDVTASPAATAKWAQRFRIHQNTIHCAITHRLDEHDHLLLTGGDDNALNISRCSLATGSRNGPQQIECSTLSIPRAHAAAVTGIVAISLPGRKNCIWVVTSSIDQQLKLWEVHIDASNPGVDGLDVRRLQNVFTPVADVSDLALCESGDDRLAIVVCGVGMDVWHIKMPFAP